MSQRAGTVSGVVVHAARFMVVTLADGAGAAPRIFGRELSPQTGSKVDGTFRRCNRGASSRVFPTEKPVNRSPSTGRRRQEVIMIVRHRIRRAVIALAAVTVIPLGLLAAAGSAQAATTYQGKVTTGVNVRSAPTSAAPKTGSLARGTTVTIQCKVYGPSVAGNDLWYKLSTGRWVTARYIDNIGAAPRFCGSGTEYNGRVSSQTSLAVRSGPHTANAKVSSVPRGGQVFIVCKVDSQRIDGNPRWYQLVGDGGGQWVAARYVTNVGAAPPYC